MQPTSPFPPHFQQNQIDLKELTQALAALGANFLRPAELESLAEHSLSLNVPANATLFNEGAKQPYLFLIESGRVELHMRAPGRPNVKILSLGPGNILAWSALVPNQPMTCSASTSTPSRFLAIPSAQLHLLAQTNTSFAAAFYQQITIALSQRLTATRLQLLDLYHPHLS